MNTLEGTLPSRRSWIFACLIVVVLTMLTIAVAPAARLQFADAPTVVTVFFTLAWAADALTAFLFVIQGRIGRSKSRLVLASGYAYSSLIIALHALTFPGIFAPSGLLGADSQSAIWFWVAWHGGFPLFVIAYALVQRHQKRDVNPQSASPQMLLAFATIVVALVALIAIVVLKEDRALPVLIQKGRFHLLISTGVGPAVIVAIGAAIASLVVFTRLRRVTDVWLTVALVSSFLDCALTLAGSGRYTLGWDVSRAESLVASTIVLATFLRGLDKMLHRLAVLSNLDGLTGLANRRAFDGGFESALGTCARADRPISLLMIDVDSFKTYNDAYGHQGGDEALRVVADCIARMLARRIDVGARYGGEEFAVVLPMTDAASAGKIGERLRRVVANCGLEHRGSPHGVVTVSIGVATLSGRQARVNGASRRLIALADDALYLAKAAGRNRIELSEAGVTTVAQMPALRLVTVEPAADARS